MSRNLAVIADCSGTAEFALDEPVDDRVAPDLLKPKVAYRCTQLHDSQSARINWGREQQKGARDYLKVLGKKDGGLLHHESFKVVQSYRLARRATTELSIRQYHGKIAAFISGPDDTVVDELLRILQDRGIDQRLICRVLELLREDTDPGPQTHDFLQNANRLDRQGNTDAALDVIYDEFDALFHTGAMDIADCILRDIDPTTLSDAMLVGVLTATLPAKSHLPSRAGFFHAAERLLTERGSLEPGLLAGLEP